MDRENPYAVCLLTLDGFAADTFIPRCKERVDICSVLTHIIGELIIKGKHIGTLLIQCFQTEDGMQSFCQIVKGHRQQYFALWQERLRQ